MPLIRKPKGATTETTSPASSNALALLESGNQEERWAAARAAANVTDSATPSILAKALRSELDPQVREAIFTSLARMRSLASVNALMPFLRMDNANLRAGALDALRSMPDVVREHLPQLLSDADSDVRLQSCEIARGLPSDEATRILCNLLANETEHNVCASAIEVLTEVGSVDALPALTKCAEKFKAIPFLIFAVKIATDRILSQSDPSKSGIPLIPPTPHE